MLEEATRRVNEIPGQYDAGLADCRAIAKKNGVEFDESRVPARGPRLKPPRRDRREVHSDTIFIDLDGSLRGFANVSDAATTLAGQLPPAATPDSGRSFPSLSISRTKLPAEPGSHRTTLGRFAYALHPEQVGELLQTFSAGRPILQRLRTAGMPET